MPFEVWEGKNSLSRGDIILLIPTQSKDVWIGRNRDKGGSLQGPQATSFIHVPLICAAHQDPNP